MPTVLVSGFGPFPGAPENASWDALAAVAPSLPTGWRLRRVALDVAWARAAPALLTAVDADTRIVVAFGQADDAVVRLERFALNAPDPTLEDVDGRRPPARYIREDGPAAYESGLPIERLLTLEVPEATLVESHYAGGYLCNFTFYEVMHLVARERRDLTAGFVHVPPAARQPLAVTTRAMRSIIEELVGDRDDSESSEPAPRMPNEGANL